MQLVVVVIAITHKAMSTLTILVVTAVMNWPTQIETILHQGKPTCIIIVVLVNHGQFVRIAEIIHQSWDNICWVRPRNLGPVIHFYGDATMPY